MTDENREKLLLEFEKNIGKQFKLEPKLPTAPGAAKPPILLDTIAGVDWKYFHVCGQKYGNFLVDLCQLVKEHEPPGIK